MGLATPVRFAVALAALAALAGWSEKAHAGATVDLVFESVNGNPIPPTNTVEAAVGDVLEMAILMLNDQPLTAAVFSLNYDVDGDDELDVVSAEQWEGVLLPPAPPPGDDFFAPLSPLSPTTATFVGSFQGVTSNFTAPATLPTFGLTSPCFPTSGCLMGTVTWRVNAGVNTDGADISSGTFNAGIDGFADATFTDITGNVLFHSATVNLPSAPDGDGDGVPDESDNCQSLSNADQADNDGDSLGDVCDDDDDNDGIADGADNCVFTSNADQADNDGDSLGDVCDDDDDNDGIADVADNCAFTFNPDQADLDGDGLGDACDGDADNDGLPDDQDPDPLDSDADGDTIPDGQDVEFVQDAVSSLPADAFRQPRNGNRNAMLRILENVEARIAAGDIAGALTQLNNLRPRVDGCGATAHRDDWIPSCTDQLEIRALIDLLISNLGG